MASNEAVSGRALKGLGLIFFIVGLALLISSSTAYAGLMGLGVVLFLAGFYGTGVHK